MTVGNRQVRLDELLTEKEITLAMKMYLAKETVGGSYAKRVAKEIIEPVLSRINAALGQENDALYLAYAVELAMTRILGPVR